MAELTDKEKEALRNAGDSAERIKELSDVAKGKVQEIGDQLTDSFGVLETVNKWLGETGRSLEDLGNLVGPDAVKFGLLSNAIMGATKEFENFANATKGGGAIGTIGGSMTKLIETVSRQGTAFSIVSGAGEKLFGTLSKMGVPMQELMNAASKGATFFAAYAQNFLVGADNALRFQSGIMQAAAAGGNLNEIYKGTEGTFRGVGEHLENLNKVTSHFQNIMGSAMMATGIESVDVMAQFTGELLKSNQGLEAMTKGMDIAGTHTDTLTGIIRLAHGAQLDVMQTFKDINTVSNQYGVNTEDATAIVMRQVDVSKDLKARQEDVHEAIFKTLNTFKLYARDGEQSTRMTQGLTDSVKNWAAALKSAGVSTQNALDLATKYTTQLEGMDEAQESFVNQQTGGAGGLLGTLEFEDLLSKDPAAAAAKAAEAMKMEMKKQGFSQIISKEQAIQMGEAGARQYQLQRQLTQSGIFGSKAQSKQESDAMIAALASGGDISKTMSPEARADVLADTMQKGKEQEQLAFTAVKEANITAEIVKMQGGTINLETLQNAISARAGGVEATGRGINIEGRDLLRRRQSANEAQTEGPGTAQAFKEASSLLRSIPTHITSAATSIGRQTTSAPTLNETLKQTGMDKTPTGALSPADRNRMIEEEMRKSGKTREQAEAYLGSAALSPDQGSGTAGTQLPPSAPGLNKQGVDALTAAMHRGSPTASRQVGQAIPTTTTAITAGAPTATTGGATGVGGGTGGPVPVTLAPGSAITVNFTGTCLHCGRPIHQNEHTNINNAASGASNRGVQ